VKTVEQLHHFLEGSYDGWENVGGAPTKKPTACPECGSENVVRHPGCFRTEDDVPETRTHCLDCGAWCRSDGIVTTHGSAVSRCLRRKGGEHGGG